MIIKGHGLLFDPSKNKSVARFVSGELETNDARIIELAKMAGFEVQDHIKEVMHEHTKEDLINIAEGKGIEVDRRWGIERLKKAVL